MSKLASKCFLIMAVLILASGTAMARPLLTIAVFDFDIPSQKLEISASSSKFGNMDVKSQIRTNLLTEKIITEIVKSKRLAVVERSRVDAIMREAEFSKSGLTNPENSIKLGKLLGAKLLLFGSLNNLEAYVRKQKIPYTSSYRVSGKISLGSNLRIVDSQTGKIVAADELLHDHVIQNMTSARLEGKDLQLALNGFVHKLVYKILDEIFPVKVALFRDGKIYLNRGSSGGVCVGKVFKVVRPGEAIIDKDTGINLGSSQTDIGLVKVTSVETKMSIARVVRVYVEAPFARGDICKPYAPARPPAVKRQQGPDVEDVFK